MVWDFACELYLGNGAVTIPLGMKIRNFISSSKNHIIQDNGSNITD